MMKLYRVRTVAKEYHGCNDVVFSWLRDDKPAPRPYAELIENYDLSFDNFYQHDAIDQLFTADEANALKDYLDREHGDAGTTTIDEETLPIPNDLMGVGSTAVGGGDDFYCLHKEPSYSLPFKVLGYFDLVDCKLADGSGERYRHYLHLMYRDADGETVFRQETQEEARRREKIAEIQPPQI